MCFIHRAMVVVVGEVQLWSAECTQQIYPLICPGQFLYLTVLMAIVIFVIIVQCNVYDYTLKNTCIQLLIMIYRIM